MIPGTMEDLCSALYDGDNRKIPGCTKLLAIAKEIGFAETVKRLDEAEFEFEVVELTKRGLTFLRRVSKI